MLAAFVRESALRFASTQPGVRARLCVRRQEL
jgi:hypothetical protein